MLTDSTALIRLLHLVSPTLPTGAFAYSQGIEWAVDANWIRNAGDLETWLRELLNYSIEQVDIPLFSRLYDASKSKNLEDFGSRLKASLIWTGLALPKSLPEGGTFKSLSLRERFGEGQTTDSPPKGKEP